MLSVAKLTLGQEAYYEQQVARGLDDYYAGRGESPGIWAGPGAAALGLVGVVEDGELGTLLRGVDPASGARLRAPVRERTITVRTLDLETGEWREEPKRLAPVSGYDLVFSCPKSVSLLHALTDDEQVRREVSEAHEASWQAALGYLEREACVVRRGHGGAVREHGEGFVAAAFRHRTSRAQDPHLHTHVIVANLARAADGEWRALDGEAILRTYRLAAGYLYEAQLRHELTRAARRRVDGAGEGHGRARPGCRRRRCARSRPGGSRCVEHMEALGHRGFAAARVAALATREAKEQVDLPRLREQWLARAAEHGLGASASSTGSSASVALTAAPIGRSSSRPLCATADREADDASRCPSSSAPSRARCATGRPSSRCSRRRRSCRGSRASSCSSRRACRAGRRGSRPASCSQLERAALELALAGRDAGAPRADGGCWRRMLLEVGRRLSGEQRMLVHEAATRPDRVVCVVGAAGAGKTTALASLGDAYQRGGMPVLGAAPSGRAADELAAGPGIASRTLHRLLLDAQREGGLPHGCVLVVDEAGMAETRVLAPLLASSSEAGGKAILVGDPAQLPPVGAGGLYPALCERLGAIRLTENRRQHDPAERDALARLATATPRATSHTPPAAAASTSPTTRRGAKQRLLADWWQTAPAATSTAR